MNIYSKPLNALRGGLIWLAGIFGIGLMFLAWVFYDNGGEERELAARLLQLPDVHAVKAGEEAIIVGVIADTTPLLRDEFVAFQRVQRQGGYRGGTEDVVVETGKQPLDISTSVGRVRIVNDDYTFDERAVSWATEERVDTPPGLTGGAITISGFALESLVVAVGTVEQESAAIGEPVKVRASSIVAGPLDRLVAQLQEGAARMRSAIPYLLIGALLLLAYAVWDGRRFYRN